MPDLATRAERAWPRSAGGVSYPPEPWHLGGQLLVSSFRLPVAELPAAVRHAVPDGHRLVAAAGRTVVTAAVAHYAEGGVLAYEELLVALPVRARGAVRFTIPQIWVTSEHSRHGGRELWGIPKDLAAFDRRTAPRQVDVAMQLDGRAVASLHARLGRRLLPGSPKTPLPTAQRLAGGQVTSRNVVFATLRALHAEWRLDPDGPLGYLAGRRPFLGVALDDAAIVFGTDVVRS